MVAEFPALQPGSTPAAAPIRVGFIIGPTGVGKTAFAVEIAERLGADIVNCDSRQLYLGMDIGTAKPTASERQRVTHHLIDVRSPDQPIDAAEFADFARVALAEVAARARPALVVGGSGLYLRVLRAGIFAGPRASPAVRAELIDTAERRGLRHLHEELRRVDQEAAVRISPNDLRRVVRALEVFRLTGIAISEHQRRHRFASHHWDTLTIGLSLPRDELYQAINRRFDAMIEAGLIDEVRALVARGHAFDRPPLDSIGYREIAASISGELTFPEALEQAKRASRQLAKRQLTWFRKERDILWMDAREGSDRARELLARFFAREGDAPSTGVHL
jgi:tRNA dimethylallyltransferase